MLPRCRPRARLATKKEKTLLQKGIKRWKPRLLPGGITDRHPTVRPRDFNQNQLAIGTKIELEHTNHPGIAVDITMGHLIEDRCYYAKLEPMERKR